MIEEHLGLARQITPGEKRRRCLQSRDLPIEHDADEAAALHVVAAHDGGQIADTDAADHELARDADIVDQNAALPPLRFLVRLRPDAFGKLMFCQDSIMLVPEVDRHADMQPPLQARTHLRRLQSRIFDFRGDAPAMIVQAMPFLGNCDPTVSPLQQRRSDLALEVLDLAADGGFRQAEPTRGFGDALRVHDLEEDEQRVQVNVHRKSPEPESRIVPKLEQGLRRLRAMIVPPAFAKVDRQSSMSSDSTTPVVITPSAVRKPAASALPMRKAPTEGQRDVLATTLVVIAMLAAMQIASAYVPDYIMPAPMSVLSATKDLLLSDKMHIVVTLARLTGAVAFSMVIGI